MSPKEPRIVHRDAGTGQFVKPEYAKNHPKTTVKDTIKTPPKRRPAPKKK